VSIDINDVNTDTYIDKIVQDLCNDTVIFDYNDVSKEPKTINLKKYDHYVCKMKV